DWLDSVKFFVDPKDLDLGSTFVDLLTTFEGVKYEAYLDSVGVWTIGVGFTEGVHKGMTMTEDEVQDRLLDEIARFENGVDSVVKVPITQYMFDAMVSLSYNIGVAGFKGSSVVKRLNDGNIEGAADAFLMWNKGTINGKKTEIAGLTRRRHAERDMFLTGDWEKWQSSNWKEYL